MSESLRSKWIEVVDMTDIPDVPIRDDADEIYDEAHYKAEIADNHYYDAGYDSDAPFKRIILVKPEDIRDMRRVRSLKNTHESTIFSLLGHENVSQDGIRTMKKFFLPASVVTFIAHLESDNSASHQLHRGDSGKIVPSPEYTRYM